MLFFAHPQKEKEVKRQRHLLEQESAACMALVPTEESTLHCNTERIYIDVSTELLTHCSSLAMR